MKSTTTLFTPLASSVTVRPPGKDFPHGGLCGKLLATLCCLISPLAAAQFEDFTYTDNAAFYRIKLD